MLAPRRPPPPLTRPACRPCSRVSSERTRSLSPWRRADRTNPSSRHSMSAVEFQAHGAKALGILRPILAHLHMQEQMHLVAGKSLDFGLRCQAHRLDALSPLAQHDGPLPLALDEDQLPNAEAPVLELGPALGLDRQCIGKL